MQLGSVRPAPPTGCPVDFSSRCTLSAPPLHPSRRPRRPSKICSLPPAPSFRRPVSPPWDFPFAGPTSRSSLGPPPTSAARAADVGGGPRLDRDVGPAKGKSQGGETGRRNDGAGG